MSKASEIIDQGDPHEIIRMALGAWFAAEEGRYCMCEEPELAGLNLMCGNCLLENRGQRALRTRRLREPHRHIYDPNRIHFPDHPVGKYGVCELCAYFADNERHIGEPISRFDGGWTQWGVLT